MAAYRCVLFALAIGLAAIVANAEVPTEDIHCPFRVHDLAAPDLIAKADAQIDSWRRALKLNANDPVIRQAMADYAINLMQRANRLDAAGSDNAASSLRSYVLKKLPDTDWRIQHQAAEGDLGAIEARLSWLRSDRAHDKATFCALANRGAQLAGAESIYRLALCTKAAPAALELMQRASSLGHPAAMETIGRLCVSGRLQGACSLDGLCRSAQSGRIGAATAIGWRLTEAGRTDISQASSIEGAAWLQRAAEAGEALAQNNLGEWLERQNPRVADTTLALLWYQRAAAQGLPAAMVNAARLLALGNAGQCRQAQSLLEQAKRAGLAQAAEWRKSLVCTP